jgi:hypothetical protein
MHFGGDVEWQALVPRQRLYGEADVSRLSNTNANYSGQTTTN